MLRTFGAAAGKKKTYDQGVVQLLTKAIKKNIRLMPFIILSYEWWVGILFLPWAVTLRTTLVVPSMLLAMQVYWPASDQVKDGIVREVFLEENTNVLSKMEESWKEKKWFLILSYAFFCWDFFFHRQAYYVQIDMITIIEYNINLRQLSLPLPHIDNTCIQPFLLQPDSLRTCYIYPAFLCFRAYI